MDELLLDRLETAFRRARRDAITQAPNPISETTAMRAGLRAAAALVAEECARLADSSGMQLAIMEKFKP